MYVAVKYFTDLQDGNHPYNVGDLFPRAGADASAERLAELAGLDNLQKVPLIKEIKTRRAKKNKESAGE
ncbi:MAG: hypothetical protein U0N59_08930 [Oscillospiraceae bacterium]